MKLIRTTAYQSFSWEREVLEVIAYASHDLGIEAWGATGLFYRPFLNGIFGPPQEATDKDVCVETVEQVAKVSSYLRARYPAIRWSVFSGAKENLDYGLPSPHWAIQAGRPISLRLGAVRKLPGGEIEVLSMEDVLQYLQGGMVELNKTAHDNSKQCGREDTFLKSAVSRTSRLVRDYPGLSVGQTLPETSPVPKPQGQLNVFPRPALAPMPHPLLETVAQLKRDAEDNPAQPQQPIDEPLLPNGYEAWSQIAFTADDPSFREWFLNQTRSRNPVGGRDEYVAHALRAYAGKQAETGYAQLHWGWDIERHVRELMLALSTEGVTRDPDLKASCRLAALVSYSPTPVLPTWANVGMVEKLMAGFYAYTQGVQALEKGPVSGTRFPSISPSALDGLTSTEYALAEAMWQAEAMTVPMLGELSSRKSNVSKELANRQATGRGL